MILVLGATGTTGSAVVRELAARGLRVRAQTRSPDRAPMLEALGAEPVVADLADPSSLLRALDRVERLYVALPASARLAELEANAYATAEQAGVYHAVKLGVLGQAPDAPFRIGRVHAEAFGALQAGSLRWTLLQPASFMQHVLGAAPVIARGRLPSTRAGAKVAMVDARDVAAVAARVLAEEGHEACSYVLTGPEALSHEDVAAVLADVLGRDVVVQASGEEDHARAMRAAGAPEWNVEGLLELEAMDRTGERAAVAPDVEALLGRPATPFRRFAEDHRAAFAG